jgi:hypothetical protein
MCTAHPCVHIVIVRGLLFEGYFGVSMNVPYIKTHPRDEL